MSRKIDIIWKLYT